MTFDWKSLRFPLSALLLAAALFSGALAATRPDRRTPFREEFDDPRTARLMLELAEKGIIAEGAFRWRAGGVEPVLRSDPLDFEAGSFDTIRLHLAVDPPGPVRTTIYFQKRAGGQEYGFAHRFEASAAVAEHVLRPSLEGKWNGVIHSIRLRFDAPEGARCRLERVEIVRDPAAFGHGPARSLAQTLLRGLEDGPRLATAVWLLVGGILVAWPPKGARLGEATTPRRTRRPRIPTILGAILRAADSRLFAAVFALSLVPRLLYAAIPLLDVLMNGDPGAYRDLALGIWSGDRPRGDPVWGWGWQGLLALLLGPSGGEALFGARLFLAVAGAATSGLVALIARRTGARPGVAALAGLLHAALEEPIRVGGLLYGETLYSLAGAALLYFTLEAGRRRPARGTRVGLGVASAVAVLVRSQALPWIALSVLYLLARRGPRTTAARAWPALGGIALAVAVSLPLALAQTGEWIPLQTGSGVNLAVGNIPGGDGRWAELPRDWILAGRDARLADRPLERDAIYRDLALAEIRRDPLAAAGRAAHRAWFFFEPFARNDWFYRAVFPAPLLPRWFLLGAFLAGLAIGRRRCPGFALPLAYVGVSWAVVIAFLHHERFIVPAMPAMCVLAAAGLAEAGARAYRAIDRLAESGGRPPTDDT